VHDASLMHCTDIFTTAVKAATNTAPVPHPPQHQTKTVHMDDAFLPRWRQKVPGGGENSPPNPTLLEPIRHGVMLSHPAPSADHTRR
jgi:hypothetical protein